MQQNLVLKKKWLKKIPIGFSLQKQNNTDVFFKRTLMRHTITNWNLLWFYLQYQLNLFKQISILRHNILLINDNMSINSAVIIAAKKLNISYVCGNWRGGALTEIKTNENIRDFIINFSTTYLQNLYNEIAVLLIPSINFFTCEKFNIKINILYNILFSKINTEISYYLIVYFIWFIKKNIKFQFYENFQLKGLIDANYINQIQLISFKIQVYNQWNNTYFYKDEKKKQKKIKNWEVFINSFKNLQKSKKWYFLLFVFSVFIYFDFFPCTDLQYLGFWFAFILFKIKPEKNINWLDDFNAINNYFKSAYFFFFWKTFTFENLQNLEKKNFFYVFFLFIYFKIFMHISIKFIRIFSAFVALYKPADMHCVKETPNFGLKIKNLKFKQKFYIFFNERWANIKIQFLNFFDILKDIKKHNLKIILLTYISQHFRNCMEFYFETETNIWNEILIKNLVLKKDHFLIRFKFIFCLFVVDYFFLFIQVCFRMVILIGFFKFISIYVVFLKCQNCTLFMFPSFHRWAQRITTTPSLPLSKRYQSHDIEIAERHAAIPINEEMFNIINKQTNSSQHLLRKLVYFNDNPNMQITVSSKKMAEIHENLFLGSTPNLFKTSNTKLISQYAVISHGWISFSDYVLPNANSKANKDVLDEIVRNFISEISKNKDLIFRFNHFVILDKNTNWNFKIYSEKQIISELNLQFLFSVENNDTFYISTDVFDFDLSRNILINKKNGTISPLLKNIPYFLSKKEEEIFLQNYKKNFLDNNLLIQDSAANQSLLYNGKLLVDLHPELHVQGILNLRKYYYNKENGVFELNENFSELPKIKQQIILQGLLSKKEVQENDCSIIKTDKSIFSPKPFNQSIKQTLFNSKGSLRWEDENSSDL